MPNLHKSGQFQTAISYCYWPFYELGITQNNLSHLLVTCYCNISNFLSHEKTSKIDLKIPCYYRQISSIFLKLHFSVRKWNFLLWYLYAQNDGNLLKKHKQPFESLFYNQNLDFLWKNVFLSFWRLRNILCTKFV